MFHLLHRFWLTRTEGADLIDCNIMIFSPEGDNARAVCIPFPDYLMSEMCKIS